MESKKWKRSNSSDFDSVKLLTPLTTPIFDFHKVIYKLSYDSDYDFDLTKQSTVKPFSFFSQICFQSERVHRFVHTKLI